MTIKQWFESVEDKELREDLLANLIKVDCYAIKPSLAEAIMAFNWRDSINPRSLNWNLIYEQAQRNEIKLITNLDYEIY